MISLSAMVRDIGESSNTTPTHATTGVRHPAAGKQSWSLKKLALRDPADMRDEDVPMLGVVTRRMLERSDEARDIEEERGILLDRVSLR
jgi:hypothetical protein